MLLFLVALTACSEYDLKRGSETEDVTEPEDTAPDEEVLTPDIAVSPELLDFNNVLLDCERLEIVTVSNVGDGPLNVSGIQLGDGDQTVWSVVAEETSFALAPGESREVELRFSPGEEAHFDAALRVSSNDPDEPEVDVYAGGDGIITGLIEEIFHQEASGAVDVLWVVDNSESMASTLTHVGNSFESFIDPFLAIEGLDWQMAVVTTDMEDPSQSGRFQGATKIITPDLTDPRGTFIEAVDQGATGANTEQPFAAIQAALTEPLVSSTNAGFLRDEARLTVIVVSDEDDYSGLSPSTFTGWFESLKPDTSDTSFSAFCGDPGGGLFGCSEWVDWSTGLITAISGDDLYWVVEATDGVWASICSNDFGDALSLMSLEAAGMSHIFYLAATPTSAADIDVFVDGEAVRYDNVDGWLYDSERNAVVFYGAAIPGEGAVVEITYNAEGTCE